jgi:hypothetical protein
MMFFERFVHIFTRDICCCPPYIFSDKSLSWWWWLVLPWGNWRLDENLLTKPFSVIIDLFLDFWGFWIGIHTGHPDEDALLDDSTSEASQWRWIAWPQLKIRIPLVTEFFVRRQLHIQHTELLGANPWEAPFLSKVMV